MSSSIFLLVFISLVSASILNCTVYYKSSSWTYELGRIDPSGVAVATFEDTLNITGWGILDIKTNNLFPDSIQAYGAGFAEGLLTAARIYEHHLNMHKSILSGATEKLVIDWLAQQDQWSREQIKNNPSDEYWQHVGYVFSQFDGLVDGYNQASKDQMAPVPLLRVFDFQVLNGDGDLFQIIPAIDPLQRIDWDSLTVEEAERKLNRRGHCSGLVKVTGNFSNLFMGHSSWYTYSATNRIFKHYHFAYKNSKTGAQKVSFSSYPAYLESLDDFYMMDSGLGMVQTSLDISNASLYKLITPKSLLAWQRVRTACAIAKTGEEWYDTIKQHHSGTYCNQYMVVDFKRFTPGKSVQDGTLWVVEEIPGFFPGQDMSALLSYGYWPSYNVAYYQQVQEASGLKRLALKGVPSADYQLAPRAKLFRRDQGTVVDYESFKSLLRSNNYPKDPYSPSPCSAICCRGDLGEFGSPGGCYDTKATDYFRFQNMIAEAINGPTYQNQVPFSWSGKFSKNAHIGLPEKYTFDFIQVQPKQL